MSGRVENFEKAAHLVQAARELLEEAAFIVPEGELADELRESLHTTIDPIAGRIEASRRHATIVLAEAS